MFDFDHDSWHAKFMEKKNQEVNVSASYLYTLIL